MRFRSSNEPMIRSRWFVRLYKISTNLVKRSLPQDFSGNPAPGAMIIRFEFCLLTPIFMFRGSLVSRDKLVSNQLSWPPKKGKRRFSNFAVSDKVDAFFTGLISSGVSTDTKPMGNRPRRSNHDPCLLPRRQFHECIFAYEEIGIPWNEYIK